MKTILMTAVAAATLIATPAFAQTASSTINLNGNVTNKCGAGNHIGGSGIAAGFTSGDINVADFTNTNGQFGAAMTYTNRSFGQSLWCNYNAKVSMTVTPFVNTSTNTTSDTGSFATSFDVRIVTDAGVYMNLGENLEIVTNGADVTKDGYPGGAFETGTGRFGGADVIQILPKPRQSGGGYLRPVAGTYKSTITFTVAAS